MTINHLATLLRTAPLQMQLMSSIYYERKNRSSNLKGNKNGWIPPNDRWMQKWMPHLTPLNLRCHLGPPCTLAGFDLTTQSSSLLGGRRKRPRCHQDAILFFKVFLLPPITLAGSSVLGVKRRRYVPTTRPHNQGCAILFLKFYYFIYLKLSPYTPAGFDVATQRSSLLDGRRKRYH
jgi:hypothetical protein